MKIASLAAAAALLLAVSAPLGTAWAVDTPTTKEAPDLTSVRAKIKALLVL